MAFLSDEQLSALTIDELIFHVVGPDKENDLVLLDVVDSGSPEGEAANRAFFAERIKSANKGNMFQFENLSVVKTALTDIEANPTAFVERSKDLATSFHGGHKKSASKGVFMLLKLSSGTARFYALLKYDHETVISYVKTNAAGRVGANLSALTDTFVQSPQAVQKSAIISLATGEICVRDRTDLEDISDYFRVFLGAKRVNTPERLTKQLVGALKDALTKNADELGPVVTKNYNQRVFAAVQALANWDPEQPEQLLTAVFGPLSAGSKVRTDFNRSLEHRRIQSERFPFHKASVPRPRRRQLVTIEGIEVRYTEQDSGRIDTTEADGETIITIRTAGIQIDDDLPDDTRRGGPPARPAGVRRTV